MLTLSSNRAWAGLHPNLPRPNCLRASRHATNNSGQKQPIHLVIEDT